MPTVDSRSYEEWYRGQLVVCKGDLWRIHNILPHGSLVIKKPTWAPRWWPFGRVMIVHPFQASPVRGN